MPGEGASKQKQIQVSAALNKTNNPVHCIKYKHLNKHNKNLGRPMAKQKRKKRIFMCNI